MGTINHNAVIATTWNHEALSDMVEWLENKGIKNFAVSNVSVNLHQSIVIFPDGSKEGWEMSDEWDRIRMKFMDKLDSFAYEDGSNPWNYVEVGYGEYGQAVIRGNNENCFSKKTYATL